MFRMTANVEFEGLKPIKPSSLKWSRHIDNYSDTAKIEIPVLCRYIDINKNYSFVESGQIIKEGQKVKIFAGYDGKNKLQFDGFVKRINSSTPLEIECEGYSYQLRNKTINRSFSTTTVKKVLQELVQGTDIKVTDKLVGEITFEPKQFKNAQRTQVLDWLKENYHLKIFFIGRELHAGFGLMFQGKRVKHRLNWNVIKDSDLLFNTYQEATVIIEGVTKLDDGTVVRTKATNTKSAAEIPQTKEIKILIKNSANRQQALNALQAKENKKGYVGGITGFLVPHCEIGMTTELIDAKFADRNGSYIIDGVDGSFSTAGGRQKIHIDFSTGKNGKTGRNTGSA